MPKANDIALIGVVGALLLATLACIGVVSYYAYKVTNTDYRYDILKREYTELIYNNERNTSIKISRLEEQLYSSQYTLGKKIELLEEQLELQKKRK